jgi:hypothetical protein
MPVDTSPSAEFRIGVKSEPQQGVSRQTGVTAALGWTAAFHRIGPWAMTGPWEVELERSPDWRGLTTENPKSNGP